MFPVEIYWYVKNGTAYTYLKPALQHLKDTIIRSFTFQNLAGALVVVLVSFSYLKGNAAGGAHQHGGLVWAHTKLWHWLLVFFLPEVGIYLLCLWNIHKRNCVYYLCTVCFLVYPFITVGNGPDFCMRATIPALTLLFLMTIKTLQNRPFRRAHRGLFILLLVTISLGSITPLHELTRTVYYTRQGYTKVPPNLSFNNFFGWQKGNLFLKYFGKRTKN